MHPVPRERTCFRPCRDPVSKTLHGVAQSDGRFHEKGNDFTGVGGTARFKPPPRGPDPPLTELQSLPAPTYQANLTSTLRPLCPPTLSLGRGQLN